MLHPAGRVSEVQRRQMTTVDAPNVHNVAVEGTFDDCQDLVKALFADAAFRDAHAPVGHELDQLGPGDGPDRLLRHRGAAVGRRAAASFAVPTGNFGNVLAGLVRRRRWARRSSSSSSARNRNDILTRWVATGDARQPRRSCPTLSPSMDIQVSSNLERLLFELLDRDGAATAELMAPLPGRRLGRGAVATPTFAAARLDDDGTLAEIADVHGRTGYLVDPHTAVGLGAAPAAAAGDPATCPIVCLATAHPAKFPDAVEEATGIRPALPDHLADLLDRPERYDVAARRPRRRRGPHRAVRHRWLTPRPAVARRATA